MTTDPAGLLVTQCRGCLTYLGHQLEFGKNQTSIFSLFPGQNQDYKLTPKTDLEEVCFPSLDRKTQNTGYIQWHIPTLIPLPKQTRAARVSILRSNTQTTWLEINPQQNKPKQVYQHDTAWILLLDLLLSPGSSWNRLSLGPFFFFCHLTSLNANSI